MFNLHRLFGASVTYADVHSFLAAGVRETSRHDYKRELPKDADKVAKTLVSFANTYGGLMLVGVDQADDGAPRLPALGVDGPVEHHASRVQQIANEAVDPPVSVDIKSIQIPVGEPNAGRHLLLVRIAESAQAPHAVLQTGAIYIRRADHASKEVEVFPPLKTLELLLQRREGPERLREQLWERAVARAPASTEPRFSFGVGPLYPRQVVATEATVKDLLLKIGSGRLVTVVGGAQVNRTSAGTRMYYRELYTHGFFFESGPFVRRPLEFDTLAGVLAGCWRRARESLGALNVHGLVLVRAELQNVKGATLDDLGNTQCAESVVRYDEPLLSDTFLGSDEAAIQMVQSLRWGLGHPEGSMDERDFVLAGLRNSG